MLIICYKFPSSSHRTSSSTVASASWYASRSFDTSTPKMSSARVAKSRGGAHSGVTCPPANVFRCTAISTIGRRIRVIDSASFNKASSSLDSSMVSSEYPKINVRLARYAFRAAARVSDGVGTKSLAPTATCDVRRNEHGE